MGYLTKYKKSQFKRLSWEKYGKILENNHCFGLTATTVAKDLKIKFPNSKIIYAADTMDYSNQKNEAADALFYGELTNDCRGLSEKEAKRVGLSFNMHLYPWENVEEEWTTVQAKQHRYQDVETTSKASETKAVLDNE